MIPASYFFVDAYRQEWEAPVLPEGVLVTAETRPWHARLAVAVAAWFSQGPSVPNLAGR